MVSTDLFQGKEVLFRKKYKVLGLIVRSILEQQKINKLNYEVYNMTDDVFGHGCQSQ